MKKYIFSVFLIVLCSCTSKISKEDISYLNGYWEISNVTFPDGSSKEYKVNTNVDYIKINNLKGFKKKMQPTFNGSYKTTNDAESFIIFINESIFEIYYKNNLSERKERILKLSKNQYSVVNEEGVIYNYKKYTPINVNTND